MGKVYLVGAGPGSADLLTLKAARLLAAAGTVIYDRLVSEDVLTLVNPRAERIYAGKQQGEQDEMQRDIYALLLARSATHDIVVRLKGGDPMVFGRGAEEWQFLAQRGVDVELVPGVSSALAVPSLAGIPLTCRGVAGSFAVVTGHRQNLQSSEWSRYASVDTLVVLMGVEFRDIIATRLIEAGRDPDQPVAFVERGATPSQRVVITTLGAVSRREVDVESPAVFISGEVVRLRLDILTAMPEEACAG
jgi:uroporphyrin-III C-methyltransferase